MANQRPVRLFYLGGLAPDEKAHPISLGTRVFRLPPIGEYLEVTPFQAQELIARYKMVTPGGLYDAFSLDPKLGETAKAVKEGRLTAPPKVASAMSNEELLELLRSRGVEVAPAASTAEEEEQPTEDQTTDAVREAELLAAPLTKKTRSKAATQE